MKNNKKIIKQFKKILLPTILIMGSSSMYVNASSDKLSIVPKEGLETGDEIIDDKLNIEKLEKKLKDSQENFKNIENELQTSILKQSELKEESEAVFYFREVKDIIIEVDSLIQNVDSHNLVLSPDKEVFNQKSKLLINEAKELKEKLNSFIYEGLRKIDNDLRYAYKRLKKIREDLTLDLEKIKDTIKGPYIKGIFDRILFISKRLDMARSADINDYIIDKNTGLYLLSDISLSKNEIKLGDKILDKEIKKLDYLFAEFISELNAMLIKKLEFTKTSLENIQSQSYADLVNGSLIKELSIYNSLYHTSFGIADILIKKPGYENRSDKFKEQFREFLDKYEPLANNLYDKLYNELEVVQNQLKIPQNPSEQITKQTLDSLNDNYSQLVDISKSLGLDKTQEIQYRIDNLYQKRPTLFKDINPGIVVTKSDINPGIVVTKSDINPGIVVTKSDINPGIVVTKSDINPGIVVTKSDINPGIVGGTKSYEDSSMIEISTRPFDTSYLIAVLELSKSSEPFVTKTEILSENNSYDKCIAKIMDYIRKFSYNQNSLEEIYKLFENEFGPDIDRNKVYKFLSIVMKMINDYCTCQKNRP